MPHYVHIIYYIVSLLSAVSDIPRGSSKTTPHRYRRIVFAIICNNFSQKENVQIKNIK